MIPKIIFLSFSLVLFVYLLLPGPDSINDFPDLPNSFKSDEPGDTYQVPNVAGYYSNNYRNFVTDFYRDAYQNKTLFSFLPIFLNHPSEYAFTAIKDQTKSTYLEEYVYPLRGSLFVNGFEPFYEEDKALKYDGAIKFIENNQLWETKATLRYYPVSLIHRVIIWFWISISIILLWKMFQQLRNSKNE